MNGKFNWVPFLKNIEVGGKAEDIDYGDILINLKIAKVKHFGCKHAYCDG